MDQERSLSKPDSVAPDRQLGDIGSRVIYEDDTVRVWHLKLAPGERSPVHRHELDHLLIQISGDLITVVPEADTAGPYTQVYEGEVVPGMVTAVPAGGVETAVNTGRARYHEVIVELKKPPGDGRS